MRSGVIATENVKISLKSSGPCERYYHAECHGLKTKAAGKTAYSMNTYKHTYTYMLDVLTFKK